MAATWRDKISLSPDIYHGEPVVRGTRVSVSVMIGSLADGDTNEPILASYPQLTMEDIRAALRYAAEAVTHVDFVPLVGAS